MSQYYKAKRTSHLYDPNSRTPFRLSRSRLELFMNCPRCFYLDRRLGVDRPPGFPFSLNSAVDTLLKKEFDLHRAKGSKHPLMETYGVDAIPFQHAKMEKWRDSMRAGITYLHPESNFVFCGGIDDVWVNPKGELMIVDYKATAKDGEVNLDAPWQDSYKRQMEMYQWLFRKNGFPVSSIGYFVYCNGQTDRQAFDGKLEFNVQIIPYTGDSEWVDKILLSAQECLSQPEMPLSSKDCDYCAYRKCAGDVEKVSTLF